MGDGSAAETIAATTIQSTWRGSAVRLQESDNGIQHMYERHEAATSVQAVWRGGVDRSAVKPVLKKRRKQQHDGFTVTDEGEIDFLGLDWRGFFNDSGHIYFYNQPTETTQWDPPQQVLDMAPGIWEALQKQEKRMVRRINKSKSKSKSKSTTSSDGSDSSGAEDDDGAEKEAPSKVNRVLGLDEPKETRVLGMSSAQHIAATHGSAASPSHGALGALLVGGGGLSDGTPYSYVRADGSQGVIGDPQWAKEAMALTNTQKASKKQVGKKIRR